MQFLRSTFFTLILFHLSLLAYSQNEEVKTDSISLLGGDKATVDSLNNDPNKVIEDAALDIGQNRGLFIITPDQKMQMRILGSVRYLVVHDQFALKTKSSFYTWEIPTGDDIRGPSNYYNDLSQSRMGFEITRQTNKGNVFIRMEMDFAGSNGYRLRHAYGQFQKFIFGQTWSLFSQVISSPSTVDFSGLTGANIVRNPQIRYTAKNLIPNSVASFALEYSQPQVTDLDTAGSNVFQMIPDITVRIDGNYGFGRVQLSGILPTLTAELSNGEIVSQNGYGISVSGIFEIKDHSKFYINFTGGRGIARYLSDFDGQRLDLIIDPYYNTYMPLCFGSNITYEHHWNKVLYSNASYGIIMLEQFSFYPPEGFYYGHSIHINTFWKITDGARLGLEYIYGQRENKSSTFGEASRFNAMIYYDF